MADSGATSGRGTRGNSGNLLEIWEKVDKVWKAALLAVTIFLAGVGANWYFATNKNLERTDGKLDGKLQTSHKTLQTELSRSNCRLFDALKILQMESDEKHQAAELVRLQSEKTILLSQRRNDIARFNDNEGEARLAELTGTIKSKENEIVVLRRSLQDTRDRQARQSCTAEFPLNV